jgi:beta-galactosidase
MSDGKNPFVARGVKNGKLITDSATVLYTLFFSTSPEIAINVGSNAQFIDAGNTIWLSDGPYRSGTWGHLGDDVTTIYSEPPDKNVLGTLDDPLFQTMQENLTGYRFDVPAGDYQVDLLFAEMKINKPGERVFDVIVNGEKVIEKLDLAKQPGFQHAFIKQCRVNTKGGITIEFKAIEGKPILSGIRVKKQ